MIAPEFKDRLMSALHSAVDNLNTGGGPDAAVAKAASAAGFNREQTKRLCETFNTARTLYHYQAKPGDKEASFPLADYQSVLGCMLDKAAEQEPTASDLPDYSEYGGREWMAHDGILVHADADAELWPVKAAEEHDLPSIDMQARRAYKVIDTYRNLAKEAESVANQAEIHAASMMAKLATAITNDFDRHGADRFERFRVGCLACEACQPTLAKLGEFLPERVKTAAQDRTETVVESRDLHEWNTAFADAKRLSEKAANTRATGMTMAEEADTFERTFVTKVGGQETVDPFEGILSDFSHGVKQGQSTSTVKVPEYHLHDLFPPAPTNSDEAKRRQEMSTRTVSKTRNPGLVGNILESTRKGVGESAAGYIASGVEDAFGTKSQERDNKKITERLRNQQREVVLQDLMMTDPFISEADPQQVINAYQTVLQIAPEVSTQKEVVRAILRQAIQSVAVGAYDASAWADLEKTIKEIRGTLPQKPQAQKAQGVKR